MRYILYLSLTLLLWVNVNGQSWQWGKLSHKRALTKNIDQGFNSIASDKNGNIYRIFVDSFLDAPDHFRAGYSIWSLLLVSFNKEGNYRWSKILSGGTGISYAVHTDTLGGVYVNTWVNDPGAEIHLDNDVIIPPTKKGILIVKYDTSGSYLWHRMPEPDDIKDSYNSSPLSVDVSPSGESRILSLLPSGKYCDNQYEVVENGYTAHVFGYNRFGEFDFGMKLDVQGDMGTMFYHMTGVWDYNNDHYYIVGPPSLKYGDMLATKPLAVGKFDRSGKLLWLKQGLANMDLKLSARSVTQVNVDATGNLYICCPVYPGGKDTLELSYSNTFGVNSVAPAIIKLKPSGAVEWATFSQSAVYQQFFRFAISGDQIAVVGASAPYVSPGALKWGNFVVGKSYVPTYQSYYFPPDSSNYGGYLTILNRYTGSVLTVDSFMGSNVSAVSVTAAPGSNFYLACNTGKDKYGSNEQFSNSFYLPNRDTFRTDYMGAYVVKYGWPENIPEKTSDTPVVSIYPELYPNPCSDWLKVSNFQSGASIRILNGSGQTIWLNANMQQGDRISTNLFRSGIYFLNIQNPGEKERRTIRFLKQ